MTLFVLFSESFTDLGLFKSSAISMKKNIQINFSHHDKNETQDICNRLNKGDNLKNGIKGDNLKNVTKGDNLENSNQKSYHIVFEVVNHYYHLI
jgi:hypothetical protein